MRDACKLIKPDATRIEDIAAYRREMLAAGSSMDGTGPLKRMDDIGAWLELTKAAEHRDTLPEGLVVAEQFLYVRQADDVIVGMIQFRHYFNDFLEKYGGHIGYSVRPGERRKGYAKRMLAECLKVCKAAGLDRVLITCIQGNEGSRRTILASGGVYEATVYCERDDAYLERYWVRL